MTVALKQGGKVLLIGILFVGLVGVLVAYPSIVGADLPALVYSRAQMEFLDYNVQRNIAQAPATWNFMWPGTTDESGVIVSEPAIFSAWEHHVLATLDAHYEEQGGVSVTEYDLDFRSEYRLQPPAASTMVELIFPFPGNLETLHDVQLLVNGKEPPGVEYTTQYIRWQTVMEPGEAYDIVVAYRAEGVNSFEFGLYKDRRLNKLDVTIDVSGLRGSEVLTTSLPPTSSKAKGQGDSFTWDYTNLVANRDIRLKLPQRLSFAQRVAELQDDFRTLGFLAPLFVGLFLIALAGILWLDGLRLGLEVYFLLGLGLALFYPLLTFLSGLVHLVVAAIVALVLVSALEILFLGLATGWHRGRLYAAWLLLIVLGMFSLGMLTPYRGLLVTVGGLLLLGTFMVLYARRAVATRAAGAEFEPIQTPIETQPEEAKPVMIEEEEEEPEVVERHCPRCARVLGEDYEFCPGCGYDLQHLHRCKNCGYEQLVVEDMHHCLHCGKAIG